MIPTERPLDNPINWSFRVARVRAIDVRVHVAFVLAAAFVVWMQLPDRGSGQPWSLTAALTDGLGIYAILFAIVLLHEFGHCYGARRTGGEAHEVLLWPLGGLAYVNPPNTPRAHLITAMAGPTVNVIICAVCSGAIAAWVGRIGAVPWNPLHPTLPADPLVIPTVGQMWLMRVFGISYFLLLINLLPIFPFDGGRILQAFLWQKKGYRTSIEIATSTGMIAAIGIGLFGLFADEGWLLIMIAVFGYMSCLHTRRIAKEQGDFSPWESGYGHVGGVLTDQDYSAAPVRKPGYLAARKARRAALAAERERKEQAQRQRMVEDVLRKISQSGIGSLTSQERTVLEEETRRRRTSGADAHHGA